MPTSKARTERITFSGYDGGSLAGRLELPFAGKPRAVAIFAHCFTCGQNSRAATVISRRLAAEGIATLRFDFTGLGGSDGDFGNTNYSSNIADLRAAADHLNSLGMPPSLLIGHSLGGAAVLRAASEIEGIKAVATIGAPFDPGHVIHNFGASADEIREKGEAPVVLGGRTFTMKRQFLDDLQDADQKERIAKLRPALLVLHSPIDATVGIENATKIFITGKHPKSFVTLDKADHLLSGVEDAEYAAATILTFATRYLDLPDVEHPDSKEDEVVVELSGDGKFHSLVSAQGHAMVADEPRAYGGFNAGPSPYGFLLSGLGACTVMTLRMYAERKGIDLTHASVKLSHQKVHAKDCETCETTKGKVDIISRELTIEGNMDAETRARMLEIADMCPVHRSLENEVKVETTLTA